MYKALRPGGFLRYKLDVYLIYIFHEVVILKWITTEYHFFYPKNL